VVYEGRAVADVKESAPYAQPAIANKQKMPRPIRHALMILFWR